MNSKNNQNDHNTDSRRKFLKIIGASTVGASIPNFVSAQTKVVDTAAAADLHICMGLNMSTEGGKGPGEALATNVTPTHGCAGGNSCKGLGACGTGDYATQYWVGENNCANTGGSDNWIGTGGCGIPIGNSNTGFISTQLNSASPPSRDNVPITSNVILAPYPAEFLGQPVWNIARARFEKKMVAANKSFKQPAGLPSNLKANAWTSGTVYKNTAKLPKAYPLPSPPKAPKPAPAPPKAQK